MESILTCGNVDVVCGEITHISGCRWGYAQKVKIGSLRETCRPASHFFKKISQGT